MRPSGSSCLQQTGKLRAKTKENKRPDASRSLVLTWRDYQSISNTQKNYAAPTGFRVSIGGTVPPGISLAPVPGTLTALMPQVGAFEAAMIEKQVVLVDPQTRKVAVVIKGAE